jgi:sigma-B regulation protein RsbU (phosphoserine phosphatase)
VIRFLRGVLVAGAVLITVLDIFGIEDFINSPCHGIRHNNLVFLEFEKDSPNRGAGLVSGDRILAVDGIPIHNIIHFKNVTYSNHAMIPQVYTMARGDSIFDVEITFNVQPNIKIFQKLAMSLTAFSFILVGIYVILRRPDILGRLFAINCLCFSFLLTERPDTSIPILHILGELFYDGMFAFLPAFFLHFFLIFPGKYIHKGSRRSIVSRALYIPPAIIFTALFALALNNYPSNADTGFLPAINGVASIYWFIYMLCGVGLFIRTYVISDRVQRIKFRIAAMGLVAGTVPVTVIMLLRQFAPGLDIPHAYVSMLSLSFISISFGYAIIKHDAFDMRVVFKTGLAYVILPVILASLTYLFIKGMWDKFPDFPGIRHFPMIVLAVVLAAIAFVAGRDGIQKLVDRFFLKNRQKFQEKMIDFTRKVQFLASMEEISELVSREIFEIFGPAYVHIFTEDRKKQYTLCRSHPPEALSPLTSFPPGTGLIQLAAGKRQPVFIEYFDTLWIKNNLDRISLELLSILKVAVVVPLVEQNEMLGFILVGPKKSGRPYNGSDAEMLELLGERTAAAIRHNNLYRVSLEKEKLEKEVHLASKIQQRLLPESAPVLKSARIVGRLRNSREVGGDFYDFVELSEGVTGVAVADVSGKGIPASLLMTTLQATFRSEALAGRSPGEVLSALNKSLYRRSELSKFATFFYAIYDDNSGLLHYSNGGSFPPLVVRSDGRILHLKRGGTLIGVDPDSIYSEGIIKLLPGDMLIIYTDGIIDQEDSRKDYFGEGRLVQFLKEHDTLDADSVVEKLYDTLLSFGEGMIKDDMTIVVLKRNPSMVPFMEESVSAMVREPRAPRDEKDRIADGVAAMAKNATIPPYRK